jgi:hypothetical protein
MVPKNTKVVVKRIPTRSKAGGLLAKMKAMSLASATYELKRCLQQARSSSFSSSICRLLAEAAAAAVLAAAVTVLSLSDYIKRECLPARVRTTLLPSPSALLSSDTHTSSHSVVAVSRSLTHMYTWKRPP